MAKLSIFPYADDVVFSVHDENGDLTERVTGKAYCGMTLHSADGMVRVDATDESITLKIDGSADSSLRLDIIELL
jgi:hypothetical protein